MLIHQTTTEKLKAMRLETMAELLLNQQSHTVVAQLSFEERLGLLVDYEWISMQKQKAAKFA